MTLSGGAALIIAHWETKVAELTFNTRANNIASTLQSGLNRYFAKIVALRGLLEAAEHGVTRREFRIFADRILEGQPAILSVSWIPRVRHDERAAHERAAVEDGIADYRIRSIDPDGQTTVSPEQEEYFPVYYTSERWHAQRVKTDCVFRIVFAPAVVRHIRKRLSRIVVARRAPPSTIRCATRAGAVTHKSVARSMARTTRLVAMGFFRTNSRFPANMQ